MQNREELRQKGTIGVEKRLVARVGEIPVSFLEREGGINIVFGPKYRPLMSSERITVCFSSFT
jgi:hypothetical protein